MRLLVKETMGSEEYFQTMQAFMGGFGKGCMSRVTSRQLRARITMHGNAPAGQCGQQYWWAIYESKALALRRGVNVFVIEPGKDRALKYTSLAAPPVAVPVKVSELGPDGTGDHLVTENDYVFFYNGTAHYNGAVVERT